MRRNEIEVRFAEYTSTNMAVSSTEGERIYNLIVENLSKYDKLILDFSGISLFTTAFLNAAIGKLYKDYSSNTLSSKLKVQHLSESDSQLLKLVTDRAKEYYKDQEGYDSIVSDVISDN